MIVDFPFPPAFLDKEMVEQEKNLENFVRDIYPDLHYQIKGLVFVSIHLI